MLPFIPAQQKWCKIHTQSSHLTVYTMRIICSTTNHSRFFGQCVSVNNCVHLRTSSLVFMVSRDTFQTYVRSERCNCSYVCVCVQYESGLIDDIYSHCTQNNIRKITMKINRFHTWYQTWSCACSVSYTHLTLPTICSV